jgi:phage FluMu protein Com
MQLRCYRCGWSFGIKKEEITFAIEALEESGGVHYDIRCPRCRHANKISLEQLKRAAPRSEEEIQEVGGEESQDNSEE